MSWRAGATPPCKALRSSQRRPAGPPKGSCEQTDRARSPLCVWLLPRQVVADYTSQKSLAMAEGGEEARASAAKEQVARQRAWLKRGRGDSIVKDKDLRPRKRHRKSCLQWIASVHNQASCASVVQRASTIRVCGHPCDVGRLDSAHDTSRKSPLSPPPPLRATACKGYRQLCVIVGPLVQF